MSQVSSSDARSPDPADGAGAFELRSVGVTRAGRAILSDVSLALPGRGISALVGPSGAGKSTVLRLLDRLDEPSTGEIRFGGRPLQSYEVRALRRRVAFVFQAPVLFPGSVEDNLRVAVELGGAEARRAAPDPAEMLGVVGLGADFAARQVAGLSGGERQRASIARALMTAPDVLLLDEPTSSLDPELALRVLGNLKQLGERRGMAIIMSTHRLSEARQLSAQLIVLDAGRVLEAGASAQLFAAPRSERTRQYLASEGGSNPGGALGP